MFCNQCQETMKNVGCDVNKGACGKEAVVADLQDELVIKVCNICKESYSKENMRFVIAALFSTITNANFDESRFKNEYLVEANKITTNAKEFPNDDENVKSLKQLVLYGIKGMSAYASHAKHLGYENEDIYKFFHKTLATLLDESHDLNSMLALVDETGACAVKVMALLDEAHVMTLGAQEVSKVKVGLEGGNKGILISGHDMSDLYELLKQTEGKGIDIYTHGEMLTAHAYPKLKAFSHLKGHFGTAWQNQQKEFPKFNGSYLFTTNCIQKPSKDYIDNVFTMNEVGFGGVKHIRKDVNGKADFSELIKHTLKNSNLQKSERSYELTVGFAKDTVMSVADKIIDGVKSGAIRKFVVMGGCDGYHKSREYYTEFAKALSKDTIILTAGCAKYRYNALDLGEIAGIPRVLDAGQCNDCYSLAYIALQLKDAFGLDDINDLPLEFNIAWYEQKAVTVLLALLHLGFKGMKLGPTLPGFLSKDVVNYLVENVNMSTISTVKEDIKAY